MLGSFVDTNRILNEIEPDRTAPEAPDIGTGTDRNSEVLHLQVSQQRSDDPRRGGRMSSDVRETWSTESPESTIGNNLDEADDILDGALRNGSDNPHSEFGTAGSIKINLSNGLNKIGTDPTTIHRKENSKGMEPNTENYLGGLSESEERTELEAERYWQPYVELDEHKDAHGKNTSTEFEKSREPEFKEDRFWEAYEEPDEHKDAHGKDTSPESQERCEPEFEEDRFREV